MIHWLMYAGKAIIFNFMEINLGLSGDFQVFLVIYLRECLKFRYFSKIRKKSSQPKEISDEKSVKKLTSLCPVFKILKNGLI